MTELDLRFGAPVFTADGREIGTLLAAVVDEEGFDPHSVVVLESDAFSGRPLAGSALCEATVLVPARDITEATPDRVALKAGAAAVRRMPPYLPAGRTSCSIARDAGLGTSAKSSSMTASWLVS